jgi:protein-disulfide isomerase
MKDKNLFIPVAIVIAGLLIAGAVIFTNGFSGTEESKTASLKDAAEGDSPEEASLNLSEIASKGNVRGNPDAPITILEFSDFQCPFCSRFHQTMLKIMDEYPDKVKWVYRHFPLDSIHPVARKAAEASECAGDQNKFWEYNDQLFAEQDKISPGFLKELAQEIGLNTEEFNQCLDSGKYASLVEEDLQQGLSIGVRGTPGNFINDQTLGGAVPYEQLKTTIDSLLQ